MTTLKGFGLRALVLSGLACGAAAAMGCSAATEDSVKPRLELINRAKQPLGMGDFAAVNGTYTNCANRTGSWSLRVGMSEPPDSPLSVVKGDVSCELTVTSVTTGQPPFGEEPWVEYPAATAILLTDTYDAAKASAFGVPPDGAAFYANARLNAVDFMNEFTLELVYSNRLEDVQTPQTRDVNATPQQSSWAISNTFGAMPPDYDLRTEMLSTVVDVNGIIVSASGSAELRSMFPGQQGEGYRLILGPVLKTFGAVDAAYGGGTSTPLSGTESVIINASAFALQDQSVASPLVRTIIIQRTTAGVRAYQTFEIRFHGGQV